MLQTINNVVDDLKILSDRCVATAANSIVRQVSDAGSSWSIVNQKLSNNQTDYFNIGLYTGVLTPPAYLIEQNKIALVFLLISTVQGRKVMLLNFRFEPGLINGVNLTATIQSTPNNYLRSHGGNATPFIEVASHPTKFGRVIHDSEQYDWGEYYLRKKKRFLIVEYNEVPEIPIGFCWVALECISDLLLADQLITNDLRSILVLMLSCGITRRGRDVKYPSRFGTQAALALCSIPFELYTADSRRTKLGFFESKSSTREVFNWIQPLLVPADPMKIQLCLIQTPHGPRFAVERRTQIGLLGLEIWLPSYLEGGNILRRVCTCAEGGRFWNFEIVIELLLFDDYSKMTSAEGITWMSKEDLMYIASGSLESSLELRTAFSLVLASAM